MEKIEFTVSARTIRLIGRENVANAEGAIIELVKNAYDADANNCIVYFDNKYNTPPNELSKKEYFEFLAENKSIAKYYTPNVFGDYLLNKKTDNNSIKDLTIFFHSKSALYIIDNGEGMNKEVIKKGWMHIGTDFKLNDIYTPKGRIRSGAKGIGRFALDRLGDNGEMITLPKSTNLGYNWKVNWSDFEEENVIIGKVTADLFEITNMDFKTQTIESINDLRIESIIKEVESKTDNLFKLYINLHSYVY